MSFFNSEGIVYSDILLILLIYVINLLINTFLCNFSTIIINDEELPYDETKNVNIVITKQNKKQNKNTNKLNN